MGRCVWINDGDVDGEVEVGNVVTARVALSDWCLRGDDGGEPIERGAAVEVIELRPWGGAMVEELPALSECEMDEAVPWANAMRELQAAGLWVVA